MRYLHAFCVLLTEHEKGKKYLGPESLQLVLSGIPCLRSPHACVLQRVPPRITHFPLCRPGENNWQLHEHLVEVAGQVYMGCARSLSGTTTQLVKSHSMVQVRVSICSPANP